MPQDEHVLSRAKQREKYQTSSVYHAHPDDLNQGPDNRYGLRHPFGLYFARRRLTDFLELLNSEQIALKDKHILDIGAHYGFYTNLLAFLQGSTTNIVAIDFMESFLRTARRVNPAIQYAQWDLHTGLPFEPHSFDFVLCNYVFGCFSNEDATQIAAAVSDTVRPGGHILFFSLYDSVFWKFYNIARLMWRKRKPPTANSFNNAKLRLIFPDCKLMRRKVGLNMLSERLIQHHVPYWLVEMLDVVLPAQFYYALLVKGPH